MQKGTQPSFLIAFLFAGSFPNLFDQWLLTSKVAESLLPVGKEELLELERKNNQLERNNEQQNLVIDQLVKQVNVLTPARVSGSAPTSSISS